MRAVKPQNPGASRDLTRGMSALFFWCLPIAMLVVGGAWQQGGPWRVWLWVIAFAIMGAGCVINLTRCGRTHCYVTGPVLLLAAIWSLLAAAGAVALHPNDVSLAVVVAVALGYAAEIPLGRYIGARRQVRGG